MLYLYGFRHRFLENMKYGPLPLYWAATGPYINNTDHYTITLTWELVTFACIVTQPWKCTSQLFFKTTLKSSDNSMTLFESQFLMYSICNLLPPYEKTRCKVHVKPKARRLVDKTTQSTIPRNPAFLILRTLVSAGNNE